MATSQRAALLTKTHTVLKKHYKPHFPPELPLLEQLLFACCLENARFAEAEKAFEYLRKNFFDWNEIRVSTIRDLSEALDNLPHPAETGAAVRAVLQHVFERTYAFDLEGLRKLNLGKAIHELEAIPGASAFAIAYLTQSSLGGHAIPLDQAAMELLHVVGAISESELEKRSIGGIERAIAKSKGAEFSSLLHQFAADFWATPDVAKIQKILVEISPDSKERYAARKLVRDAEKKAAAKNNHSHKVPVPVAIRPAEPPSTEPAPPAAETEVLPDLPPVPVEAPPPLPPAPAKKAIKKKAAPAKSDAPLPPPPPPPLPVPEVSLPSAPAAPAAPAKKEKAAAKSPADSKRKPR